jgi:hypothetical protein
MRIAYRYWAGVAAILVFGLFAPCWFAIQARAADLFPKGSNATLVFTPTSVVYGQSAQLCAFNGGEQPAEVTFLVRFPSTPFSSGSQPITKPARIFPGNADCLYLPGESDLGRFFVASIVLDSPVQCRQATDYPGKCGMIGSLEIAGFTYSFTYDPAANRIHMDPVLRPGSAGLLPPPIAPQ